MTHDAHRYNLQRFVAGDRNSGLEISDKEGKQMRRILAEIEVPDGKYCVTDDGLICNFLSNFWRFENKEKYCELFKCDLKELAFAGTVPVKCDECASAGVVLGAKWTERSRLDKEPDRPKFKVGDRVNYKSGIGEHDHGTVVTITESVTGPLLYGVRTDNDNTVWSCHDTELESIPPTCSLDGDCNG